MFGGWFRWRRVSPRLETLIGRNTRVEGDVIFLGRLHCDGTVSGAVRAEEDSDSLFSLSHFGTVEGEVRAPQVRIDGVVFGDVYASQRAELGPHAQIEGNVLYTQLEMAVGAKVNGQLSPVSQGTVREPLALADTQVSAAPLTDPSLLEGETT
jgi:cytoskeletal protein CcmA (bactofilin family)